MTNITWFEARAFCELRGARLPTEREWEYAARGPDGLIYPWGNEWDEACAICRNNSGRETAEVGSRPSGVSWVGALDMSGNVFEWTSSLYRDYPYVSDDGREDADSKSWRSIRGSSWFGTSSHVLSAVYRSWASPFNSLRDIGLRCVHDYS